MTRLAHSLLLLAAVFLCAAAPTFAATKLCLRLDPDGAKDSGYAIRVKSNDANGKEIARAAAGAKDGALVDQWDDDKVPAAADRVRQFCIEVVKSEQVIERFKLAVDVPQAIRYLNHQPGSLQERADKEPKPIYITVHYPPDAHLGQESRKRYEAATGKRCPPLLASVDCAAALPGGLPMLHSELRPARAAADKRFDVFYSSLEVARCVQVFNASETAPIPDYDPAVVRPYADWMTKNFQTLGGKTLGEVMLPGTHDSGSYDLGDRKAPDTSAGEYVAGMGMNLIKPWAKTQRLDIKAQLEGGIRWIDMRTAYDGSDFYFYHALLGPTTRDMLRQIRAFLDEPGHEHELIELEFCNWQGLSRDTPDEVWQRLSKLIVAELGEQNIYRRDGPQTAQTEAALMKTRLADILTGGKSRVLVFFQGHTALVPYAFDAYKSFGGSYANKHLWPRVEADQRAKLAAHRPGNDLFVLSWTVTANQECITTDLASRGTPTDPPYDLEYLSRGGQGESMRGISRWPGHEKINILICDFFDTSPIMPLCFALNGIPQPATNP